MMKLTGLHLLLTYQCTLECDHCFVWGSPWQEGTMTMRDVHSILKQAKDILTVNSIYFEGGEPFLYYPVMVKGVQKAAEMGFHVGIVTNSYWATSEEDALIWLEPFRGLIQDLSVSSDLFHWEEVQSQQAKHAEVAAKEMDIPIGYISIAQPTLNASDAHGQLPLGESKVMFRGRAAMILADKVEHYPWNTFTECPFEDLQDPGRLHVDPLGNLHICQGISLGNLFSEPLSDIWHRYDPGNHPITGPILEDGPMGLVKRYAVHHEPKYADACHLCDDARRKLRTRFPDILMPDQVYGVGM
jgi:MoaA/NifB/PqqE/SkfB family radical SAM enzyme